VWRFCIFPIVLVLVIATESDSQCAHPRAELGFELVWRKTPVQPSTLKPQTTIFPRRFGNVLSIARQTRASN